MRNPNESNYYSPQERRSEERSSSISGGSQ